MNLKAFFTQIFICVYRSINIHLGLDLGQRNMDCQIIYNKNYLSLPIGDPTSDGNKAIRNNDILTHIIDRMS